MQYPFDTNRLQVEMPPRRLQILIVDIQRARRGHLQIGAAP